jgi:hypothetical protein
MGFTPKPQRLSAACCARWAVPAVASLLTIAAGRDARAADHHFGFVYESALLPKGQAELDPWLTERAARADYYSRLEAQLGFRYGLAKNFQAGLFWNLSATAEDILVPGATQKTRLSDSEFESVSAELEYRLSDRDTDTLGSALLLRGTIGPLVASTEGRLILDKPFGPWLFAANVLVDATEELDQLPLFSGAFAGIASAGYFVTPNVVMGLEVRSESAFSKTVERSVLYFGPSVSVTSSRCWATFAVEPQIAALKGATVGHSLDLDQNERVQVRLLLGFSL